MKKYLYIIVLLITSAIPNTYSYANNAAGGELICEWISDSTYRFYLKYYRVCNAASEPATVPLCLQDPCNTSAITTTMTKFSGPTKLSSGCTAYKTTCDSPASNISGFTTTIYTATVTLATRCNQWRAFTTISGRAITNNIQNAQTTPMYLEYKFNNTGSYQGNSSPYFSISPFLIASLNTSTTYNNGAIDPNGDSLVTQLIAPQTAASGCSSTPSNVSFISAVPNINIPSNPFPTNYTFTLFPPTGQMSFVSVATGLSNVAIRVNEYRNGILIGSTIREMIINTISNTVTPPDLYLYKDCNTANPPVAGGFSSGTTYGCVNQPLSFCFDIKNTDTNNVYYLSDNHSLIMPGAAITYTNQGNDSVRATFTWIPTKNDAGIKNLVFTVKDSTCRPYRAPQYFSYPASIYIWEATTASLDTAICAGERANLNVTGGGNYTWTVLQGGSSGSLSCATCSNPTATPTTTTRYAVVSQMNSACPTINKDTVQVVVYPPQPATVATGDTTICLGEKAPLLATGAGNYKWTVINGSTNSLSCDQCPNPWASPFVNTRYIVTSANSLCAGNTDTVDINVLQTPPSYPTIKIAATSFTYVLKNYPVTFTATAIACDSPLYQWYMNGHEVAGETSKEWKTTIDMPNANVYCKMTCTDKCAINKVQYSNTIRLTVVNSIDYVSNNNDIDIYPNPGNGHITINIKTQHTQTYNLEIFNTLGQSVYTEPNVTLGNNSNKQIDLSNLPAGIYTLKLNQSIFKISINH